jgi:hypothetical protein
MLVLSASALALFVAYEQGRTEGGRFALVLRSLFRIRTFSAGNAIAAGSE